MHSFQPFPIEQLELNPFTKIGNEWALVTAGNKEKYNTMTVSWGGLGVMWGKNVAFLFIRNSRYTKEFIDQNGMFSISFLNEKYRDAMNYCGSNSGRNCDKFKEAKLTAGFRHGIPYVDEASLVLVCSKMAAVPIEKDSFTDKGVDKWYPNDDMHVMYVAEIVELMAR